MVSTARLSLLVCAWISAALALPLRAQEEVPTDLAPELALPSLTPEPATGSIVGTVLDNTTAEPIAGVEVTLIRPASEGGAPSEETVVSDAAGKYEFSSVPEGTYSLRFAKPGYAGARWNEFPVLPGQPNPGDFALAPESKTASDGGVEEIVVTGTAKAPEVNREISDEFINTMDMSEIGKFAASDIGEAIKRIAGINVVEGQFAIIRGLEDRYSSTLYNSAPVPSPDPDSQSVQLDLFPSEVTSNLVVAKTFASDLPSNSSGGMINILTAEFPEDLEIKLSGGSGFNENAIDRSLGWSENNPIGTPRSGSDATEGEFGALVAGTKELLGRQLSFRGLFNWERDYQTQLGWVEAREPQAAQLNPIFPFPVSGGLSLGKLDLSGGRFDFTTSEKITQKTGFVDLGFDLDSDGMHHVGFSFFYSNKEEEVVQARDDGFIPGFDYAAIAAQQANGDPTPPPRGGTLGVTRSAWIARSWRDDPLDQADRGPLWSSSFNESRAFDRDRDLFVYQLNGEHEIDALPGLRLTWAANHAQTNQDEGYLATRYWYEPADPNEIPTEFPVTQGSIGGGGTFFAGVGIFQNANEISEDQDFFRFDLEYERELTEWMTAIATGGFWWESAGRDVASSFLDNPTTAGGLSNIALPSATALGLGDAIMNGLGRNTDGSFAGTRTTSAHSERDILAGNAALKLTLWERLDLLAGVRHETIEIAGDNDPFTGEFLDDGAPRIFPSAFLMFDRFDHPGRNPEAPLPPGSVFNDQILNIDVPIDPLTGFVDLTTRDQIEALVNGRIDETRNLPSAGVTYRPIDGLNLRAAYSQTVARPSFREIGYYVTVETGSDDLVIGNPQLTLSDVESWDLRVEYVWGDFGDLAAISAFTKTIQRPIESIVLRDPTNAEISSGTYRTFFNNPNDAKLWGIELEGRKALDFVGVDGLEYLSLAANFTWIDAEVKRSPFELAQAAPFLGTLPGVDAKFDGLAEKRRLFSQPEWIVNADISFDHPEWGTKLTLAVFAISDVLDTAGNAAIPPVGSGSVFQLSLDRYVDSFYQVDLVGSQTLTFGKVPGEWTAKVSVKNLTDSVRRLIYDTEQTAREYAERSYKIGRDYSISLTYDYHF